MGIRNVLTSKLLSFLLSGWSDGTIEEQRTRQEKMSKYFKIPAGIQCQAITLEGMAGEWIQCF